MCSHRAHLCVFFFCLSAALFTLCAGEPARGQEASWALTGPAFSASVEELQKAAAAVTPEKFTEATIFFERDAYTFDGTGRVTVRHSMIYRIETQAGVEGWSESSARWEPWHQNRPEIHARVIEPDGKVSQLDQKTVTDGPASEEDEDVYTDARIRKAPLPGLTAGAIVEEETVIEDKSPLFSGGGVYRDFFGRTVPVVLNELTVEAPKELKLQYRVHLMPAVKVTDEEQTGVRHLKFVQGYMSGHEDSDIPLATHVLLSPMIEFSTGESWASVARAYRELAEAHIDPEKVKALVPNDAGTDRLATIQRLVARLHKEIRYTGIEFGQATLQPETAGEILKRHYGDCKDKAALLVGMLRAAGVPAYMALVDTGPGIDLNPELPGMNQFDHAIVYVPAEVKGGEALWIDATAEYAQVGTLPRMDEGRESLVIAEDTSALTLTPTAKPEDDQLTEVRDVMLAEYGGAHITETSLTHGPVDQEYRSEFGGAETREKKTNLENYAKGHYLAKALTAVEHGDGKDLTKPFLLKLDMAEAKRGNTLIDDAAVAIPFSGLFNRLPEWFKTDPKTEGEKPTPQQEEDRKRAVHARASEYDVHPQIVEWRYKITPPAGFVLRALPEEKNTEMGPARFTQHYETDSKGVISAVLRFNTVKPRYTLDEVLALREAVLATYKQDMIMIEFDQEGAKLLAAGKIREALAADRALIEREPNKALPHVVNAYALLQAGMGDRARAEALKATMLDAKSLAAYKALGWVCQFNAIGIQYARGFDEDCSGEAYKRAVELDAEDMNAATNLAISYEFDRKGERYTSEAKLANAIRVYKAIKEKDKSTGEEYEDSLLFDLLYSHQYKELLEELGKLPSSATRYAMGIAATVAKEGGAKGIAAGIDRADHLSGGTEQRSTALTTAGNELLHLRLYAEACEILSAGVEGQKNSAAVTQQISIFRNLKPWSGEFLPASDPRSVVQQMFIAMMRGDDQDKKADELLSRHAYGSDEEWRRNNEKMDQARGFLHILGELTGTPASVLLDMIAGNMKLVAEGDDQKGYRVSVQSVGSGTEHFFVSKDDGAYKIVADGKTPSEVGNEVLYLLRAGREAEAHSILDWMRDRMHKGGGDDPLSGPLLPRFWTIGESDGVEAMRMAAASLVASNSSIKELLPAIQSASEKAATEQAREDLGLLLGRGYATVQDGAALKRVAAEILKKYPDSYVAIGLAGEADELLKDWSDWNAMLDSRIAKHPEDEMLLRLKCEAAEAQGDFALARATTQKIIDLGKATANDYNRYAWTALFDGKVDAEVVKAAQQSVMMTRNNSFGEMHTLACIYAVQGKGTEAKDLLLKAMKAANLAEPNSEVWYGFGGVYEQFGATEAAIEAYKKVERPEGKVRATDTWVLAQARLKALGAAGR